jgi:hypothetical protein
MCFVHCIFYFNHRLIPKNIVIKFTYNDVSKKTLYAGRGYFIEYYSENVINMEKILTPQSRNCP